MCLSELGSTSALYLLVVLPAEPRQAVLWPVPEWNSRPRSFAETRAPDQKSPENIIQVCLRL
jgi:hypothetical protein